MRRALFIIPCLVIAAVAIVAIVNESQDEPTVLQAGPDEQQRPDGGRTVTVRIDDREFKPSNVTIGPGQTVRWVNQDDEEHTVTNADGDIATPFDSGEIAPDDAYEFNFVKRGKIDYVCTIHPDMEGTVTVIP